MSETPRTALAFSGEAMAEFEHLCAQYPLRRSALIPTLRLAQEEFGYLSPQAIQYVADLLELSAMDVLSVTSFYEMLHTEPVGKRHLWVCQNLTCHLAGAEDIIRGLEGKLGIRVGQVTRDGRFSLARAECLGACDHAPMMWCDDNLHVDLTPEKLDTLIDGWNREMDGGGTGPDPSEKALPADETEEEASA